MTKPSVSQSDLESSGDVSSDVPKVLFLGGSHDAVVDFRQHFGDQVEIVEVFSPVKALTRMAREEFTAIYCDADHVAEVADVGRLIRNDRILQGMPDGVVLLDHESNIIWGNGRLSEWSGCEDVVGRNFFEVLGNPEIMGHDAYPLDTALRTRQSSVSVVRSEDNRFYRIHCAPVIDSPNEAPQHLVVTVHDFTEEKQQQQKLAAIHQAGVELADLTTEEVDSLAVDERIELLKSNIVQCTQDVLMLDVIEIRMLDIETNELQPLLAVGMVESAENRQLFAKSEDNGVTGYVAATGKSYVCEHCAADPLYLEGAEDARSSITVPLVFHDQVIGTLNVESPEANAFTESDLQFLEIFARNVAVALHTLDLLAAEKANTAAASVDAIHSAVALPIDVILNDAVNVMERYIGHETEVVERIQSILRNARDIKRVIQKVGQSMAPAQASPTSPSTTVPAVRPSLIGKRVLVVDDDEQVRAAAHALLERYRCDVETARSAKEAELMVRNLGPGTAYDAILADIRLPDANGYEFLVGMKKHLDHVPLILMTGFGYDPGHSILKARQEGVANVLYKPFRLDQLLNAVEEVIGSQPDSLA